MLVYDVYDTEGEESPEEFIEKGIGGDPFEVKGNIKPDTFSYIFEELYKWGIKILFKPLSYFNEGYITNLIRGKIEIALKEHSTMEKNFATLIHELAHLFLGHTGHPRLKYIKNENPTNLPNRKLSTEAMELEAEAVSYLICHKLFLETRSAEYIAGYIKSEKDLLAFSYENVVRVADKIENLFIKHSAFPVQNFYRLI